LQKCFADELNQAKAAVQEPPQPKIKLKMTPGQETPVLGSKKITIHVGGSRGSTAASPAPQTGRSNDSSRPDINMDANRNVPPALANTTAASFQADNTRVPPGAEASPFPAVGVAPPAVGLQQQPAATFPLSNGNIPGPVPVSNGMTGPGEPFRPPQGQQLQNGPPHPAPAPAPAPPIYDFKYRAPYRGTSPAAIFDCLIIAKIRA
jgi:hypothetical protein